MDGTDAARRLADEARTARIPVVAMSALPLEGGGDWLERPASPAASRSRSACATFPDQVRRYCTSADA